MSSAYHDLAKSGFLDSLKRDVLLEASADLEFIRAIHDAIAEASDKARLEAITCTVQLVHDLIAKGLCSLATWSHESESDHVIVHRSREDLEALVEQSSESVHRQEYFLVTTPAGDEWVRRYEELVGEL